MAVNLTTADAALKSYYLNAVSEQLNNYVNPFYAKIKHSTENVWGKEIRKLAISGINGGIGAGTEDGDLPTASSNGYCEFVTTLKNIYGSIEISDKAIRASENNSGAFVNLLNSEMDGLIKSGVINMSRMLFGDGTGILTKIDGAENGKIKVRNTQTLFVGMSIDLLDENCNAFADYTGRKIISVDRVNKTITISGAIEEMYFLSGYSLSLHGSYMNELTGLGAIFNTESETLYGLRRADHDIVNPTVVDASAEFTLEKIQQVIDMVEEKSGNQIDMIMCSVGVRNKVLQLLNSKTYYAGTVNLEGGFRSISFNGIPLVTDRFCPKGTMYLLNTKDFSLNQLCDWQWLEDDNGKILKQKPGKPIYTATLVKYADLLCANPSGQGALINIKED
jgi:hypothetical protein